MKNHKIKLLIGILLGFILIPVIIFLSLTYGKWEILSAQHSDEFTNPIISDSDNGCLTEPAKIIKVMEYSENNAKVFVKGNSNSTYLMDFKKINNVWTIKYSNADDTDEYCHYEILNTTMGGSADTIYWYN